MQGRKRRELFGSVASLCTKADWQGENKMNANKFVVGLCGLAIWSSAPAYSQQTMVDPNDDPKSVLVGRLDLERYKATLRGLGQYGDRQQGTDRNRAAVDWIEAQIVMLFFASTAMEFDTNQLGQRAPWLLRTSR